MLDILMRGRDEFGVVAVKAEFEAEGTRPDELLRLLHLAHYANLKVALKIGGCEAISDLLSSRLYGVDHIIAPMVETRYALSKYIEAKGKTHGDNSQGAKFLFNIETQSTLENLNEILPIARGGVDGIVFGRVDFVLSRGMPRGAINDPEITAAVLEVARSCRENDLELVVGGSISPESIPVLREIREVRLDRFETRKVVFDAAVLVGDSVEDGIKNAMEFETAWLRNKRDYYAAIAVEDAARIEMMERRQAPSLTRLRA
jgi:hypothetical protein